MGWLALGEQRLRYGGAVLVDSVGLAFPSSHLVDGVIGAQSQWRPAFSGEHAFLLDLRGERRPAAAAKVRCLVSLGTRWGVEILGFRLRAPLGLHSLGS